MAPPSIALSSRTILSPTHILQRSPISPPTTLSFPTLKPLRFRISYGQFDGSAAEESGAIDEPFFEIGNEFEDEIDKEDTESSLDLLIRFLQSLFRKVSRRVKKASRPILPAAISPQLLSFAVDGILLLSSLSILKAFLEVICTIGGTVFATVLIIRVIWTGIAYFQSNESGFGQGDSSYGRTQPVF